MKVLKKVLSLVTVLALVLSLAVTASAEEEEQTAGTVETGSITVENPVAEQTYSVYRVFDLETYDKDSNAYSYVLNSTWSAFAKQQTVEGVFITLEQSGGKTYVKWIDGQSAADFAKLAIAYAKANPGTVTAVASQKAASEDAIIFDSLPLGYYLIDSSVGALCSLTTNDPDATVKEKNEQTTVEKKVLEDSTQDYQKENTAKLGDTVSFKSEITLGDGAENLVLHDAMDSHLTLKPETVKVYVKTEQVDAKNYTVEYEYTDSETHVHYGTSDNCTFNITFGDDYVTALAKGTVLCVEYDAVLGYDAKKWKTFGNDTYVTFGDNLKSTTSSTETYTYEFDLLKTNDDGILIQTAQFYLYDANEGGTLIPVVEDSADEETGIYYYHVATENDDLTGNGDPIRAGFAHVYGLDKDVCYLEETVQPAGFNKLDARVAVDLTNGDTVADSAKITYASGGVVLGTDVSEAGGLRIVNKSGTVLPGTGGIGTTLFYVLGGAMVVGAFVFFVTKKRTDRTKR